MKRKHDNELKILLALVIALLIGVVAHAQDYCVKFTVPTNGVAYKSYVLYALDANGQWVSQGWCPAETNQINFKSWNLPMKPCKLSVKSFTAETNSDYSDSIIFDTLPNPVLPPSFLLIQKL